MWFKIMRVLLTEKNPSPEQFQITEVLRFYLYACTPIYAYTVGNNKALWFTALCKFNLSFEIFLHA